MDIDKIRADIECIVGKRTMLEGDAMGEVLKRLDQVSQIDDLPEQLKHYIKKRSYVKALAWLDDPETPHRV